MKVFGNKTTTDISPGQNMPNFTEENGNFSIKNKLKSISVYKFFVEIVRNFAINFTNFLVRKN